MYDFAILRSKLLRPSVLIPGLLLASTWQAQAVHWTLSQAGPPTWTYTLQFDPEDNYSLTQSNTTITISGLSGVTAAGAPTSDDFPGSLNATNLAWTPQVLNNGTTVVWTHVGGGTGNFATTMHVFGFAITAPGAQNGTVSYATSGMARDVSSGPSEGGGPSSGGSSLDISGMIAGPSATGTVTTVPAASPLTIALTCLALALAGGYQLKNRINGRLQS